MAFKSPFFFASLFDHRWLRKNGQTLFYLPPTSPFDYVLNSNPMEFPWSKKFSLSGASNLITMDPSSHDDLYALLRDNPSCLRPFASARDFLSRSLFDEWKELESTGRLNDHVRRVVAKRFAFTLSNALRSNIRWLYVNGRFTSKLEN